MGLQILPREKGGHMGEEEEDEEEEEGYEVGILNEAQQRIQ